MLAVYLCTMTCQAQPHKSINVVYLVPGTTLSSRDSKIRYFLKFPSINPSWFEVLPIWLQKVCKYNTQYWLNHSKLFEYCIGIEKFNTQNDTSFFLNTKVFTHFCIYANDKKKYSNAHMKHTTIVNNNPCMVRTYCKFLKTSLWEGERKMQEAERIRTSETQQSLRKVWKSGRGASSNGKA